MPGAHRRAPSFGDAVKLASPSWVGQPDDDADEDEIARAANRASAIGTTVWFLLTSGVMLAMLVLSGSGPLGFWSTGALPSGWDAPWWLTAIFAAEAAAALSDPEGPGEPVGVLFCGAAAIGAALQRCCAERLDGGAENCGVRFELHKETF